MMPALRRDAPAQQGRQGGNMAPCSDCMHLLLCVTVAWCAGLLAPLGRAAEGSHHRQRCVAPLLAGSVPSTVT